ncbi:hypothetical protein F4808DRAFT_238415 [Astrocystis sublimbata]|nr:hypothetical protein F4808DRAFT_238415 [Astrocystis sublimbata]
MIMLLVYLFFPLVWSAQLGTRQASRDACFEAMQQVSDNRSRFIDGKTALDCLTSFPFDPQRADDFLTEIRKYIEFQSTLEVLRKPPDTYLSPGVDILGGLDQIRNAVAADRYTNQFDFDVDIKNLIMSANDGHFSIFPCSFQPFVFQRSQVGLASISDNGRKVPQIYVFDDLQALVSGGIDVSPIISINGQDVTQFIEKESALQDFQDPDAQWNSLFVSYAAIASGGSDSVAFWGRFITNGGMWPGPSTILEFMNGTSSKLPTFALYQNSDLIPSATDLFKFSCIPSGPDNLRSETSSLEQETTEQSDGGALIPPPTGFPVPFARDSFNQILGYTLDDDDDTTIMLIPTFATGEGPPNQDIIFAEKATGIVNNAVANRRTKLIIDLSRNGGGSISRAFDLFKLFFPAEFPYSATRMRRHDSSDLMVFAKQNEPVIDSVTDPFAFKAAVIPEQDADFASVEEFLSGGIELGANITSLYANFNYTLFNELNGQVDQVRGFGDIPASGKQPFAPENILILTDGDCSSTCTTFVNLMTNVGGVRALTFGGRPRAEPMQAMGGVRGGQSFEFSTIDAFVAEARNSTLNYATLTPDQLALANKVWPKGLDNLPLKVGGGGVNFRNAYQEGADHLPLQFEYQASDCRLFYTAENILNPQTIWRDARDAIWGVAGCVTNSTGGRGSLEYRNKMKDNDSNGGKGAGNSTAGGDGNGNSGGKGDSGSEASGNGTSGAGDAKDDDGSGAGNLQLGSGVLSLCLFVSVFVLVL